MRGPLGAGGGVGVTDGASNAGLMDAAGAAGAAASMVAALNAQASAMLRCFIGHWPKRSNPRWRYAGQAAKIHAIVGMVFMDSSEPRQPASMLQLAAAAISLIGILLTIVAAVRATNPTIPIVLAIAGAIGLVVTVYRQGRG